jgi:hypothetical protein
MENQDQPQFKPIPRSELVALSLFGNEEQREIARRLLPNTPEEREPQHPYFLAQFTPGSEAERNYFESPAGKAIEDLISSQPEELGAEDDLEIDVEHKIPLLPPLPKAPPVAPVAEEPPLGESMAKLVRHPLKPPAPKIQLPQWTKGEPYVGDDFGRPPLDC